MNAQQEFLLTKVIIGGIRGLAEALEAQALQLQPRAVAYQMTALDTRAVSMLRDIASVNGVNPDWAEQRYWSRVDAGHLEQAAFDEVCAELESA